MDQRHPNITKNSVAVNTKNFETLLEPILIKFRKRLNGNLPAFATFNHVLIEERKIPRRIYDVVRMETHKIAGSAKILGFEALGTAAADVETCIKAMNLSESSRVGSQDLVIQFGKFLSNATSAAIAADTASEELYDITPISANGIKYNVLIIDDDEFARDLVKLSLSLTGENCAFIEAETGMAGLKYLNFIKPDLVVLDVNLPDINGFDILKKIMNWEPRNFPVVMLTRENNVDSRITGIVSGAIDYITKPVSLGELNKILTENIKYNKSRYDVGRAYSRQEQVMATMKRLAYW